MLTVDQIVLAYYPQPPPIGVMFDDEGRYRVEIWHAYMAKAAEESYQ